MALIQYASYTDRGGRARNEDTVACRRLEGTEVTLEDENGMPR